MRLRRCIRGLQLLVTGAMTLQASGCTTQEFFLFVDTVFLGITAAGSTALLHHICFLRFLKPRP